MLDVMGGIWFTDSIKSFEGKEAAEMLQGAWLVEIAELHAFEKSGVERIKQFISARGDRFRAAYGRRAVRFLRNDKPAPLFERPHRGTAVLAGLRMG